MSTTPDLFESPKNIRDMSVRGLEPGQYDLSPSLTQDLSLICTCETQTSVNNRPDTTRLQEKILLLDFELAPAVSVETCVETGQRKHC